MESNAKIDSRVNLNLSLKTLFQGPTQGIENAFSYILDLLQKQQNEQHKLQLAHLDIDKRQKGLVENVKREIESANESLYSKLVNDLESVKTSVEALKQDNNDLLQETNKIKQQQNGFQICFDKMKKEVQMIKTLLPDNACSEHNRIDDDRTKSLDSCGDLESKSDKQSDSSKNFIELQTMQKQNDHIINNISNVSTSEQQVSVANHQIQLLESLAVRLDKIEDDKNKNQQDVMNLINRVETLSLSIGSSSPLHLSKTSMTELHDRLVSLESFLEGFSITNFDLIDNEESVHRKQTKILDTSKKESCLLKQDHLSSGIESGKEAEEVSEWSNCKVEIEELNSSERIITEETDETGLKKHKKKSDKASLITIENDLSLKQDKAQQHTPEETLQNIEALKTLGGGSDKLVTKPIIVSRISDDVVGSISVSNQMNLNLITRPNTENVHTGELLRGNMIKETSQHNVLTRLLLDQEKRFKSNLDLIMNRIVKLEEDNPNKLKTEDLNSNSIGLEGKDTMCENVKHDCNESNDITSQMCEMNNALNLLREEMNSKLSRQTIANKILEFKDSNDRKHNRDENIKELYQVVQDEIEYLKEHKVDRDTFLNEIEETKANLTNFLSQSISNQEAKLSNALTNVEIDIISCRDSIEGIEKSVESTETENEDVGLNKKIKSATNIMETSLQEIISSRLKSLNVLEDEVEKIAAGLAEKPDQDQINVMVKNLEEAISQRLGSDEAFKTMLQNIKTELKEKMTRNQVLLLVKQILNGAKEDFQQKRASTPLMIGHQPYRCLGCDEIHPQGVNNMLAPRVNHNCLPLGRGLSPNTFPHCTAMNKNIKLNKHLGPIHKTQRLSRTADGARRSSSYGNRKLTR